MELKINNMLEVVEIVQALEERIELVEQIYTKFDLEKNTDIALKNIYYQFKDRYSKHINFKY